MLFQLQKISFGGWEEEEEEVDAILKLLSAAGVGGWWDWQH